ncbi:MAG TPA: zinc metallopeptidase [Halothiobacillaceae bacterium]|nr:zinc metallopeptidase [Halothiobacillaceae bacterium]
MAVFALLGLGLILALSYLPSWWVRQIMQRYSQPDDRFAFSGGDLARYLLDKNHLEHVVVEQTDHGDHYDPADKAVRLSAAHFTGRSLTAITVAAHEVGHALQHAEGMPAFQRRQEIVQRTQWAQKLAGWLLIAIPVVTVLQKQALAGLVMFAVGVLTMAIPVFAHLATLPTEIDASFKRALPMLHKGGWLKAEDKRPARRILQAAALTYVAQALSSLLNVFKWMRGLRM